MNFKKGKILVKYKGSGSSCEFGIASDFWNRCGSGSGRDHAISGQFFNQAGSAGFEFKVKV